MEEKVKGMRSIINSILIASAPNLTPQELDIEYHSLTGTKIPFAALGFKSLLQCLESNNDILKLSNYRGQVCVNPVVQDNVKHIKRLVGSQKAQPRKPVATADYKYLSSSINLSSYNNCNGVNNSNYNQFYATKSSQDQWRQSSNPTKPIQPGRPPPSNQIVQNQKPLQTVKASSRVDNFNWNAKNRACDIQSVLERILDKNPSGIWCAKFFDLYERETGEDFDLRKYDCNNVLDVFRASGIPIVIGKSNSDYIVKRKSCFSWEQKQEDKISKSVQPSNTTATTRNPVFKSHSETVNRTNYSNEVALQKPSIDANTSEGFSDIPPHVVLPGVSFQLQKLPSSARVGGRMKVVIGEVYNPHNFCILISGKETSISLDNLMRDLQSNMLLLLWQHQTVAQGSHT